MRTLTAAAGAVTATSLTLLCAGCDERAPRSADPECKAEQCTRLGRCAYDAQSRSCRAASGDCAGTEACRMSGACTAAEGRCGARSDADCAQSVNCHTRGWCVYTGDYCDDAPGSTGPAPCAEREYCVTEGQCGGTPPKRCEITDEGCACIDGENQECGTDVGACQKGNQECVDGSWGPCVGGIDPLPEDAADALLQRIAGANEESRLWAKLRLDKLFAETQTGTRTIAVLHLHDGLTLEETAAEVGMSVSGVRKRLRKLRATLEALDAVDEGTSGATAPSKAGGRQ